MAGRVERIIIGALAAIGLALVVLTLAGNPARASGLPSQISTSTVPKVTRLTTTTTTARATSTTATTVTRATTATTAHVSVNPATGRSGYPATTYSYGRSTATTAPASTAPRAPSTIAPLSGGPVAPATLPLVTKGSNAHVSQVFPILSGAGFFVALVIAGGRLLVTRSGGADRRPIPR